MFAAPFRLEDTCCTELCVICMRTTFFFYWLGKRHVLTLMYLFPCT